MALLDQDHLFHRKASEWFNAPDLQWAVCPFSEAGFIRTITTPAVAKVSLGEATALLEKLKEKPGYHYQPISADWHTLTRPFFARLFGHKQVTDAYLLGLAIHEDLVLVTFDRAILHTAGPYRNHLLLLTA